jgi:tRNA G18 (ribose-2'-O)-methylase SpoU
VEPQAVHGIDDPRVSIYRDLSDNRRLREQGCFLVEGRANIACLVVQSGFAVRSVLVTPTALKGLHEVLCKLDLRVPVFTAAPEVLSGIAGYNIHRGALALGEVPPEISPTRLIAPPGEPSLIVALEHLTDPDNVGSTFRSAIAVAILFTGRPFGSRWVELCVSPLHAKKPGRRGLRRFEMRVIA